MWHIERLVAVGPVAGEANERHAITHAPSTTGDTTDKKPLTHPYETTESLCKYAH
jgi:hypothetical protein